ncbi:MAG: glycosyltransferase family 2 protein [Bacteroidota bacterium]
MQVKISAVIIVKDELENMERCLEATWKVADEVVVIDSGSTDGTQQLCQVLGARVIEHPFQNYAHQKNVAVENATYDYILSVDADEVLSEELIASILIVKSNWMADAYLMNRLNNYCGQWIKHGNWYPDQKRRLFDRRKAKWEGKIHEKVVLQEGATLGKLQGDLLHYSYDSIADQVARMNTYTTLMAESAFEKGKKATLFKIIFSPKFNFFKRYFLQLGILDGYYGFVLAVLGAYYNFLKYVKLRALWKNSETNDKKL